MCNKRAAGFTLVEMIIAIVIISVGLAGVLTAFNITVKSSADPMIHKQMLSIAEEMMEEIMLKPYAVVGVAPVNAATSCGVVAAVRSAFDDVSDYHNYQTNDVCDIDGVGVAGLAGYSVKVTVVVNVAVATDLAGLPIGAVKKVTVVVTRGGETMILVGWRTDYAS
jgi:MSHA pilin protein MshD